MLPSTAPLGAHGIDSVFLLAHLLLLLHLLLDLLLHGLLLDFLLRLILNHWFTWRVRGRFRGRSTLADARETSKATLATHIPASSSCRKPGEV
jgi:hypothetical protein